jgi:predicted amidohydrolase
MPRLRVALGQINTRVGDLDGNVARIVEALRAADHDHCDLLVVP